MLPQNQDVNDTLMFKDPMINSKFYVIASVARQSVKQNYVVTDCLKATLPFVDTANGRHIVLAMTH